MASYKKKEEERKQRREAMAKKYPMQNPRTNTAAIVTKRNLEDCESEVWKSGSKPKAESAVNRNPTQLLKGTNYPLFTNGQSGQYKPKDSGSVKSAQIRKAYQTTEERAYKIKSADGWRKYQIDEAEKRRREKEPSYQRWKAQFGGDEYDAALYRPGKNWSESAVNDFGFYYNEDKQKAYRYAATLNKGYQQIDEAFGRQLGDLEGKRAEAGMETANAVTDWLKGLDLGEKLKGAWEHQGEALKSYGDAMKRRDENTVDTAKSLWDRHQTNATTLANAQAAQTKAQTEGIREIANSEIVRSVMDHYGESMKAYGTAMSEQGEYVKEGLYLSGKYSGVTGSDQTGASIHGYREDTRYKEPGDEWTDGERRLYEFHLKNDPEEAEEYAIRTNDRYNRNQKQRNMDESRQRLNEKEILALEAGGARVLSGLKSLDGYNSLLEYSATGRISTNPEISPGEYSQLVDDTIADKIERNGDKLASDAYRFGTKGIDGITTFAIGGPVLDVLRSVGENVTDTLREEKERGATDKQAAERAFLKSAGNAVIDAGVKKGSVYLPIKDGKYLSEDKRKEIVGEIVASVGKEFIDLDGYKNEFKKQGYSDNQAEHIAIFEAIKKGGMNALDNIALTPAQKKFYDSLQKSLCRMF